MRDMHCHILPAVDDGSGSMEESLAMLDAAVGMGITSIVCTPHCREPFFDYDAMWSAYYAFELEAHMRYPQIELDMGFEVNHRTLMNIGFDWAEKLGFSNSNEFLLELSVHGSSSEYVQYERTIYELQGMGYQVVIAHPERYMAIRDDIELAYRLVQMGCKLQASADFIAGGRLGNSKKAAKALLKEGLYSYIASDAHSIEHYRMMEKALKKFGGLIPSNA